MRRKMGSDMYPKGLVIPSLLGNRVIGENYAQQNVRQRMGNTSQLTAKITYKLAMGSR